MEGHAQIQVPSRASLGSNRGRNRAATHTHTSATLTTPSGSTSSRCLGCPLCKPVSTYCPGVVVLSRTRKSPLSCSSASASRRLSFPWNQGSPRSCSAMATNWGGGGARRASSKGSGGAERWLGEAAGTTHAEDPDLQEGEARKERADRQARRSSQVERQRLREEGGTLTHVEEVPGRTAVDSSSGGPSPAPCLPGLV